MNSSSPVSPITSLRYVAGALVTGPVLILISLTIVLGPSASGPVPWLMIGIVAALGAVSALVLATVGYRLPPLRPGAVGDVETQARQAFTTALFRRFALAYPVVIISIALAFVVRTGGVFVVLTGAVIGIALAAYHVWPSERVVSRCEQALEANGVDSRLRESLGMAPRPPGFLS